MLEYARSTVYQLGLSGFQFPFYLENEFCANKPTGLQASQGSGALPSSLHLDQFLAVGTEPQAQQILTGSPLTGDQATAPLTLSWCFEFSCSFTSSTRLLLEVISSLGKTCSVVFTGSQAYPV